MNPYNMRSEETQLNRLKGGDEHEHANHKSGVSHTNSGSVEREVYKKPRSVREENGGCLLLP